MKKHKFLWLTAALFFILGCSLFAPTPAPNSDLFAHPAGFRNKTSVKVEKNKLSSPFKSCSFNIIYGQGIDKVSEIIDIAHDYEVVKVYGKSVTYKDVKYDNEQFKTMLADENLYNEIKEQILANTV